MLHVAQRDNPNQPSTPCCCGFSSAYRPPQIHIHAKYAACCQLHELHHALESVQLRHCFGRCEVLDTSCILHNLPCTLLMQAMHAGSAPGAEVAAADKDPATAAAASSTAALAAATGSRQPGMSPLQLSGSAEFQAHGNFAPANRASYLQKLAAYSAECALLQAGSDGDILAAEEVQQVRAANRAAPQACLSDSKCSCHMQHGNQQCSWSSRPRQSAQCDLCLETTKRPTVQLQWIVCTMRACAGQPGRLWHLY